MRSESPILEAIDLRRSLPLAWPGLVSALALVFAHTLGEFGVILMVGGSIPGETQTLSIAIYDRVQAFRNAETEIVFVSCDPSAATSRTCTGRAWSPTPCSSG